MFLCANNSSTSCLFFLTLFITGMRNKRLKKMEAEAAMSTYRKICMLDCRLLSDSLRIASVELFRAYITLLRQFCIIKKTVEWPSVIILIGRVDTR